MDNYVNLNLSKDLTCLAGFLLGEKVYEYQVDGKTFTYHPDFLINGKLFEVKGDQFFRINESTGKEEMFCPYGRKKLGEERWNWLCKKFEAKHQCMIKNNVLILRDKDIHNLSVDMFVN